MLFPVQDGLVQMGHAPPLGNVVTEQLGEFLGRRAGNIVAPGAEGGQQLPLPVKGHIAVHHTADAQGRQLFQGHPVFLLDPLGQVSITALKPLPHLRQAVGPDAIHQMVFPVKAALGQDLPFPVDQHRLDAGGAQLDA